MGVTNVNAPAMITTAAELTASIPTTIATTLKAVEEHNPSAVIIGAFGDPGLEELQRELAIPVIGIGTAAMLAAAHGSQPFAIATTTPALDESIRSLARRAGVAEQLTTISYTATDPLSLAGNPEQTLTELSDVTQKALAIGATKVIIGGGPLTQAAVSLRDAHPGRIVIPIQAALDELLG